MKPIFTVHEGEFLVGDHITRVFGRTHDVWVPTRDSGVDLLVTPRRREGRPIALQVKFSRSYPAIPEIAHQVQAIGWFRLQPAKLRSSRADAWVFVIVTPGHERHFVVVPLAELLRRVPRGTGKHWDLYLTVYSDKRCHDVRGLRKRDRLTTAAGGGPEQRRDFSDWLGNWTLITANKASKRNS